VLEGKKIKKTRDGKADKKPRFSAAAASPKKDYTGLFLEKGTGGQGFGAAREKKKGGSERWNKRKKKKEAYRLGGEERVRKRKWSRPTTKKGGGQGRRIGARGGESELGGLPGRKKNNVGDIAENAETCPGVHRTTGRLKT